MTLMPKRDTVVAFPHTAQCETNWALSMIFLAAGEPRIDKWLPIYDSCGGDVEAARNHVVRAFLDTRCEWLFWIDTDVGFQRDIVARLHAHGKDIVCAIYMCTLADASPDGMNGYAIEIGPSVFRWVDGDQVVPASDLLSAPKGLHPVGAMGGGCALVNRRVYEKLGPDPYAKIGFDDGTWLSEDISFSWRCRDVGFELWCDTSIPTNHAKTLWLGAGAAYDDAKPKEKR
jgi:hypothetical protein